MTLGRQAKDLGFVRDTLEKVHRLTDILGFLEQDETLRSCLALKGGTAINLTIFDLPRLSVDIDLDFAEDLSRGAMLERRNTVTDRIRKYMAGDGYFLSTIICFQIQRRHSISAVPSLLHIQFPAACQGLASSGSVGSQPRHSRLPLMGARSGLPRGPATSEL